MTIAVDIADRMYDYTDEEQAAKAIEGFQYDHNLGDNEIIAIWADDKNPLKIELENCIYDAVDLNGSAKRASEKIPYGITLFIDDEADE